MGMIKEEIKLVIEIAKSLEKAFKRIEQLEKAVFLIIEVEKKRDV